MAGALNQGLRRVLGDDEPTGELIYFYSSEIFSTRELKYFPVLIHPYGWRGTLQCDGQRHQRRQHAFRQENQIILH